MSRTARFVRVTARLLLVTNVEPDHLDFSMRRMSCVLFNRFVLLAPLENLVLMMQWRLWRLVRAAGACGDLR